MDRATTALLARSPDCGSTTGWKICAAILKFIIIWCCQGVGGRWSQVYHPRVEGDDPVFYFQRLSQDGKRGLLILKHFPKGGVTLFPKGLQPGGKIRCPVRNVEAGRGHERAPT